MNEHEFERVDTFKSILTLLFIAACYVWASSQDYQDELERSMACIPAAGHVTIAKREPDGRVTCVSMTNTDYGRTQVVGHDRM